MLDHPPGTSGLSSDPSLFFRSVRKSGGGNLINYVGLPDKVIILYGYIMHLLNKTIASLLRVVISMQKIALNNSSTVSLSIFSSKYATRLRR